MAHKCTRNRFQKNLRENCQQIIDTQPLKKQQGHQIQYRQSQS